MRNILVIGLLLLIFGSCASKKDILYLQDSAEYNNSALNYSVPKIQPNDILKIEIGALIEESAIPYNRSQAGTGGASIEIMQLEGYLVSEENTINFPILGILSTKDKTVKEFENHLKKELQDGGHFKSPSVSIRLLNAKVAILGEVNSPGTYNFTEQNISLFQALGYAGDLTINGKREDIIFIRETNGNRTISHIDLTSAEFLNSEFNQIRPNDVIIVNPNAPKIKSAGFVGNASSVIAVVSILLSTVILITR
ncbi:polysaccharide biosynthesis/export family protein [Psychroserpens sp. Hel_I_66]|uniref:polysaccharide biosynthesis/export family protein n=1 Tax=Psychroserpens sp. Hel_I_66 TaxID=1250004 RepID=UPI0006467253|nr:polysaccharide biosynthesis/export family protein [Psychroserpens sp. Hel_I_66]